MLLLCVYHNINIISGYMSILPCKKVHPYSLKLRNTVLLSLSLNHLRLWNLGRGETNICPMSPVWFDGFERDSSSPSQSRAGTLFTSEWCWRCTLIGLLTISGRHCFSNWFTIFFWFLKSKVLVWLSLLPPKNDSNNFWLEPYSSVRYSFNLF